MLTPRRLVWTLVAVLGTPVGLYGLACVYFVTPSSNDYQHQLVFDAKRGGRNLPTLATTGRHAYEWSIR